MKIRIAGTLWIDEDDLEEEFFRSSGPGGQNVNKVETAVRLRFDTRGLPPGIRRRLGPMAGARLGTDGVLRLESSRFRTQRRNREEARERLVALLREAALPPVIRRATRPTRASVERRHAEKKHRAQTKRGRRPVDED
jgi:ribosome-associated protein